MKRDLGRLASEKFDVLIVGGGIHGTAAAREAALRGLSTALIEQKDLGSATSANSLKIIHGGLRYLQHGDLRRVRSSVRARRWFFRLFPHLIAPQPCVVPTWGRGVRGRIAMGIGLALNDALSWDRNQGVAAVCNLPRGRILSRAEMLRIVPEIALPELTGGALWYDGLARDTERIVIELAAAAACAGACVANYTQAEGFLQPGGAVRGVRARDLIADASFEIQSRLVINAAGPWFGLLNGSLHPAPPALPLAKAVNIFVGRPFFGDYAVGLAGTGNRFFFFVPWRGGTMIGTLYLLFQGKPEKCAVSAQDLETMVEEVNRLYPAARLRADEVRFTHVGILPLDPGIVDDSIDARLLKRPWVLDGVRDLGIEGLIGILGVKFTTAGVVAEQAVELAAARLGRSLSPRPPEAMITDPDAATRTDRMTLEARILRGIREEMALTLGDLIFRRIGLGNSGHPGKEALASCALIAGTELGWDARRREMEIDLVEREYRRLLGKE